MIHRTTLLFVFLLLCFTQKAYSQYDDILKPQTEEKRRLFMRNRVQLEHVTYREGFKDTFYSASFIDEKGLIRVYRSYSLIQYLDYDSNSRLTERLDSTIRKNQYNVNTYSVKYATEGGLFYIRGNKSTSTFVLRDNGKKIQETLTDTSGKQTSNYYHLDEVGRITFEEYYDAKDKLKKDRSIEYNEDGKITKETITTYNFNGVKERDIYFYQYDKMNRITQKQNVYLNNPAEGFSKDVVINPQYIKLSVSYIYDAKGNMIQEIGNDKKNSLLNYKIKWTNNEKGLPVKMDYIDGKGNLIYSFLYKYTYWK